MLRTGMTLATDVRQMGAEVVNKGYSPGTDFDMKNNIQFAQIIII